ncbi:hypothetical protein AvCA_15100 [Azotobacter vinelandii CA]|uniref:Uncharacterized protein n=2 Tax=Azotobacter vinelandii TaxID=354 RepID=C1DRI7_AZOVD|nr:hypothetical protein Avin_15100 [Azotobacter vinelandii DJ]AGK15303.1 hypothetical protein AvCA_15100 [Azotobacter vinelandii CA]AGK19940.1 hypothetical protein AvCA6_15100 [Azotobacter vinelandii CA6]
MSQSVHPASLWNGIAGFGSSARNLRGSP